MAEVLGGIDSQRVDIAGIVGGSVVVRFYILPALDATPFPEWSAKMALGRPGISLAGALTEEPVVLLTDDAATGHNATVLPSPPLPPPPPHPALDPATITRDRLIVALIVVSAAFAVLVASFAAGTRSLSARMRRRLAEVKTIEREAVARALHQAQREAELQQEREAKTMANRKKKAVVTSVKISGGAADEMNLDEQAGDRTGDDGGSRGGRVAAARKKARPRSDKATGGGEWGSRPDVSGLWRCTSHSGDAEDDEEYIFLQRGHGA